MRMKSGVIASVASVCVTIMVMVSVGCGSSERQGFNDDGANADPSASTPPSGGDGDLGAPAPGATDDGKDKPCPNVDVLFVIDNSGSMSDKQVRLANSFPGFAAAIQSRLPAAKSINVGVVATSAYYSGQPQTCLIKTTSGPESSNQECLKNETAPWLRGHDPNFKTKFSCVAKVGAGGDNDETPVKSMLGALGPETNNAGGCNQGFSRPDALLVLVVISDEDDVRENDCDDFYHQGTCGSGGTPSEWRDRIVALKGGHPENVVVLSLLSRKAGDCSNTIGVNLASFTKRFDKNGFVGDVCMATYDQFFADSLPVIDQACVSFVPPK